MSKCRLFVFLTAFAVAVWSCGENPIDPVDPVDPTDPVTTVGDEYDVNGLWSKVVRATTSTVSIAWTTSSDNVSKMATALPATYKDGVKYELSGDTTCVYNVALYSDASCRSKLVSWTVNDKSNSASTVRFGKNYPPRFVFSGLNAATTYYVKIKNVTTGLEMTKGRPVKTADPISTAAPVSEKATAGDLLLKESFDRLTMGGDLSTFSAGYSRTDRASLTSIVTPSGDDPDKSDNKYYTVAATTEMGLFNTLAGLIDDYGLSAWSMIPGGTNLGAICARPGYLKVGITGQHASIVTPPMTAIAGNATVQVKFKAAPYGGPTIDASEKVVSVSVVNGGEVNDKHVLENYTLGKSATVQLNGDRGSWQEYYVTLEGLTAESRIAFGGAGSSETSRFMIDDIKILAVSVGSATTPTNPYYANGTVTYADGTPAVGVTVSDGFNVAVTDATGAYSLDTSADTWYIYVSYPADAKILKASNGTPDFYKSYSKSVHTYNFKLGEKITPEKEFALFAMADPQAHYAARGTQTKPDTDRFGTETVAALNAKISASALPCYGVTLGDIVYSEDSRNSNPGLTVMRSHFSKVEMPVFQAMGNHDFTFFYTTKELKTDDRSSTLYLKAQREFEGVFGPINHSFNRGDAHIVCMRDIIYDSSTNAGSYHGGFTDEQYEWLKADLANVSKDKMVILCIHIPIVGISGKDNVTNVLNLLKQYKNSQIFSGHTHYYRGVSNVLSSGLYEHVHSAVCGQWWWSNIEGDGCPNGFVIYDINGTTIKDAYLSGVNAQMNDRSYQMRIYQGDMKTGGKYAYFQWPYDNKTLLINVFNGDARWSVNVYENGVLMGSAVLMSANRQTWASVAAGSTYAVNTNSSQDWWSIGYHIGVAKRGVSSTSYYTSNFHMWKYIKTNASAKITVEATDPYGNVYTCSDVMTTCEYPSYMKTSLNI